MPEPSILTILLITRIRKGFSILATACLLFLANQAASYQAVQQIEFTDIKPEGMGLWGALNAVGQDDSGNIYATYSSYGEDSTGIPDVALFRYNPNTDKRSFLGTFRSFLESTGNLKPDEPILKGHTEIVCLDNKLFFGTMSVHSPQTRAEEQWGGHLLAYDLDEARFIDMSDHLEDGYFVKNGGILNLTVMPGYPYVVAYVVPYGDIAFFDPSTREIVRWVEGDNVNNNLTRVILPSRDGRLFYAWGWDRMYIYDFEADAVQRTSFSDEGGRPFWNGWAQSSDGSINYISDPTGNLYKLEMAQESITRVGTFRPDDAPNANLKMSNLNMDLRERALYAIPKLDPMRLIRFDLETHQFSSLVQLGIPNAHTVSGSNLKDDEGHLYFTAHDDSRTVDGYLLKIDINWLEGKRSASQFFAEELTESSSRSLTSAWLGSFEATEWPYILHDSHGWLYISGTDKQAFFYDLTLGWLYTNNSIYPYLYAYRDGSWLYYKANTEAPLRWFYYFGSGEWRSESGL